MALAVTVAETVCVLVVVADADAVNVADVVLVLVAVCESDAEGD